MKATEETQEMATAIALGMVIYEQAKIQISGDVPTKNQVLDQADQFFGVQTSDKILNYKQMLVGVSCIYAVIAS